MKPIPGALPSTASSTSTSSRPAVTSVSSFSASSSGEAATEASALPKTASWASGPGAQPVKPVINGSSFLRDSDLPPLSAAASAAATRKASAQAQRERAAANKAAAAAMAAAQAASTTPPVTETVASSSKETPATPTGPAAPLTPTGPKARPLSTATPTAPSSTSKTDSGPPGISKLQAQQTPSSSPRTSKAAIVPSNAPTGPAGIAKRSTEKEKVNGKLEGNDAESEKENVDVKVQQQLDQKEEEARILEAKPATTLPSAPPGLALPSAPPGLPAPGSAAASPAPVALNLPNARSGSTTSSSSSSAAGSASTYQPSSRAQALLDDMRNRRAAEYDSNGDHTRGSPFPELDWDNALSSFGEGSDFCFNLPGANGADREGSSSQNQTSGAFSPFGAPPGIVSNSSHPYSGTPPPGLGGPGSVGSSSNSSALFSYSGSFSPFGSGLEDSLSAATSQRTASPFKAIDEMRRTLSEERASNSADEDGSNGGSAGGNFGSSTMNGDDAKRGSRFGFAKRKESESTSANASPFMKHRTELLDSVGLGMTEADRGGLDQDALASSINVSGILGNVFDDEPNLGPSSSSFNGQYHLSGDERDGGSKSQHGRDSSQQSSTQSQNQYRASNAQAQHMQNMQYPPGIGSQGQSQGTPSSPIQHMQHNSSSSHSLQHSHSHQLSQHQSYPSAATPPPGISVRNSMGGPPGIGGMGSSGNGSSGMGMNGMPPGMNLRGNGASMAAQVQAQQAAAAYRGGGGGGGNGGSQDPLLAQIMAAAGARRAVGGYGQQQQGGNGTGRDPYAQSPSANGNELPFFDPAIVHSMSRPQQAQVQAAQAQAHAARYGGYDSSGYMPSPLMSNSNASNGGSNGTANGNGSAFSPFDSPIAQQGGGHHQNDYHHHQQQQQSQQQAYDRYAQAQAQAQRGYY